MLGREIRITRRAAALSCGLLGVAIGAGALWVLPQQAGVGSHAAALEASGPGFFPLIAAVLILLGGLWCLLDACARDPGDDVEILRWRRGAALSAWLAAAAIGLYTIGMLSAIGIATAGIATVFGERRPGRLALIGFATPLAIYLLFEVALRILFPRGWLL